MSIRVLEKAALLLDCLGAKGEASALELSAALNEPRSTVYRILRTLETSSLVEVGSTRGTYRLGLKLFNLGSQVSARFADERQAALPIMERLHEQTGETVLLTVPRDAQALCVERIDGRLVQQMLLRVGGMIPLHAGAGSRVLLAFESPEVWDEYLSKGPLEKTTPATPTDPSWLLGELRAIRNTGFAISDEDVIPGIAGVAAPVFDYRGTLRAALTLAGPRPVILGENSAASRELVIQGAREISLVLGFDGPVPIEAKARASA
jgi:DNA-binding IclR family transcriptional regulator